MDDVRAVMDAAGADEAALMGVSEGAPLCALFAATYPQRTRALVLWSGFPRVSATPDFPIGVPPDELEAETREMERSWGSDKLGDQLAHVYGPSSAGDAAFRKWFRIYLRRSASPGAAVLIAKMALVAHRVEDENREVSRYLAAHIPGAKLVELPGEDHLPWSGDQDAALGEVEEFLTGTRSAPEHDRMLATVLFTDLVRSTEKAAAAGDRRWADILEGHHVFVRAQLDRFGGSEIDTAGDGFFATFDGLRVRSDARRQSSTAWRSWGSRSGPGSTPASARS